MDGLFEENGTSGASSSDADQITDSQTELPFSNLSRSSISPSKSRYGRTCKPKISADYYNIDDVFEIAKTKNQTKRSQKKLNSKHKTNRKPRASFVHVTGETNLTISINSKRSNEGKLEIEGAEDFSKNNDSESKPNGIDNGTESEEKQFDENLSTTGFNLASDKPDLLDEESDIKLIKHPVKTYGNRKKLVPQKRMVESFGLPDLPIFPVENEPPLNKLNQEKDSYLEQIDDVNKNLLWDLNLNKAEPNENGSNKTDETHSQEKEELFEKVIEEEHVEKSTETNNIDENIENHASTSGYNTLQILNTQIDQSNNKSPQKGDEIVSQSREEQANNVAVSDSQSNIINSNCTPSKVVSPLTETEQSTSILSDKRKVEPKPTLFELNNLNLELKVCLENMNVDEYIPLAVLRDSLNKSKLRRATKSKTLRKRPRGKQEILETQTTSYKTKQEPKKANTQQVSKSCSMEEEIMNIADTKDKVDKISNESSLTIETPKAITDTHDQETSETTKPLEKVSKYVFPLRRSPIKRGCILNDKSQSTILSPSPIKSVSKKPVIMENDPLKEIEQIAHMCSPPKKQKGRRKNALDKFKLSQGELSLSVPKNTQVPKTSKPKKTSLKNKEHKNNDSLDGPGIFEQETEDEDEAAVDKKSSKSIKNNKRTEPKKRTLRSSALFTPNSNETTVIPDLGKKTERKNKKGAHNQFSSQTSSLPEDLGSSLNINMNETLEIEDFVPITKKSTYEVGDLVWARVGTCPYWPSMVCIESETEVFIKTLIRRGPQTFYHVKFFGDKGKRCWVNFSNMFPYQTKNDLEILFNKNKSFFKSNGGRTKLHHSYKVREHFTVKWNKAVEEIDSLKHKTVPQRLEFFEAVALEVLNNAKKEEKKIKKKIEVLPVKAQTDDTGEENTNQEFNENVDSKINKTHKKLSENFATTRSPKKKAGMTASRLLRPRVTGEDAAKKAENPKTNKPKPDKSKPRNLNLIERISFNNFVSKHIKSLKENKTELDEKGIENHLKELWNNLNPREKKIYGFSSDVTSEYSDSDTQSSSKGSTSSAIPNSMEEQVRLYKRNNLFKRVSRQRVCNHCEKANGVLKCKGPCNGLYHPECTRITSLENKEDIKVEIKEDEEYLEEKHDIKMVEVDPLDKDEVVSSTYMSDMQNSVAEITNPTANSSVIDEDFDPNKEIKKELIEDHFQSSSLEERLQIAENMNDDNRVEIISVYSDDSDNDIYELSSVETSSRKLSLFEQIDLKMKEVMGKFEDKTSYADSTTDLNSGDSTESEETIKPNETNETKQEHEKINDENVTNLKSSAQVSSSAVEKNEIDENFKCSYCSRGVNAPCFACGLETSIKGVSVRIKCSLYQCGKFYHLDCLKIWPQTQWSLINSSKSKKTDKQLESFVCPSHVCHTCVSDNPRAAISRCSSDKVVKCLRCPATYHTSNMCVPAGTIIFSSSQILCPRHRKRIRNSGRLPKNSQTINTTWCFICSEGGNLICCETCPTSVHPDCLKVNLMDDDTFICEDCESGRFPLYDEIVWAKLGSFRWWPAIILFPNEVPENVNNLPHREGEFVVRFFGSHDHYWVNRGRVFSFQEEDQGGRSHQKKKIDQLFNKAINEARAVYRLKKEFKSQKESEVKNGLKPPPYVKIKVNRPVGNVKQNDGNTSNTTACECDPKQPFPCGPDSDCINRLLLTECNPEICPAGDRCYNQRFEKRQYSPIEPHKTESRGWGLRSLAPIRKGDFVIEYVGELIDDKEYQRRIKRMHETKDENYYFLTVDKDRIIDAGPKGNLARFMNHSCQPNCETQKWTVNGDTKVGLFALEDIPANAELTFNYNLESIGEEKKVCKCGAQTCNGFIGLKFKLESTRKSKKKESSSSKKITSSPALVASNDNVCFICEKSGEVRGCCYKVCNKFYHLRCVSLQCWPEGNKWFCPSHNCNICGKRTIRCCYKCINSYCPPHAEGNVRHDKMLGFVCSDHDPSKASQEKPLVKKKSRVTATKETDITSTTDDAVEELGTSTKEIENENNNCEEKCNKQDVSLSSEGFADVNKTQNTETETDRDTELSQEESSPSESKKRKRKTKLKKDARALKKIKLEDNAKPKRNVSVTNLIGNISVQNEVKLSSTVPARHLRTTRNNLPNSASDKFLKHQSELEKDLPIRKRTRLRCGVGVEQE